MMQAKHQIAPKAPRNAGPSNRRLFLTGVERARRLGRPLAVLLVDLDRFRPLVDAFGQDAGNLILRETASRIGRCVRDGDIVSRLDGDQFAVLLEGVESPALAAAVVDRIRAELSRPYSVTKRQARLSASIGIALYPRDAVSPEELLQRASQAMTEAKKIGGDIHQFHNPLPEARIFGRLDLESRLRRAIDLNELEVYYQPQAVLADGTITSVEALLRWNNPDLGWVAPAQFILLAEETGMIDRIGEWVLHTAVAQAKTWLDAGNAEMKMCVNVSARQLNQGLVDAVSRVLDETGFPSALLELEITESTLVTKDPRTEAALKALRALGVGFAIDDFGTGYANFEYLKRLPVRTLKLDGSFARGVCGSADDAAIVTASVALARNLGLRIVAEGVETAEQLERLFELGCDDCQGNHVCQPLPAAALERFLATRARAARAPRPRLAA